jgi:superfamily I DNA/RNA helicase
VDEAQDLSPVALAFLAEVCTKPEGLFFAADNKQSLYSRSYNWSSVHPRLQFRGRTSVLRRNYRSTREIDQAAFEVLQPYDGESIEESASVNEGPLPVLVQGVMAENECDWVIRFIRQMAKHLHLKPSTSAVLVPTEGIGKTIADGLRSTGLQAQFFAGRDLDLSIDVVRVLTLHSAKGLEFPIVVVAGLEEGTYPLPGDFDEDGLFEERASHERRRLYVGLTRAMRGLMLLLPSGCEHPGTLNLNLNHWHVEEVK